MYTFVCAESVYMNLRSNVVFKYFALFLFSMELFAPSLIEAAELRPSSQNDYASIQIHSGVTPIISFFTETDSEERDSHEDDDFAPNAFLGFLGVPTFEVLPLIHQLPTYREYAGDSAPAPLYKLYGVYLI
ncbi:MAG: hypothetical protein K1X47_00245 [Cyclobacteriaceae bacterium]|nr:hypothetical protein [Cyclobacteriaceae bacterium]